jgi:hypothetical protein
MNGSLRAILMVQTDIYVLGSVTKTYYQGKNSSTFRNDDATKEMPQRPHAPGVQLSLHKLHKADSYLLQYQRAPEEGCIVRPQA